MKYLLIFAISLMLLSCSSTNPSGYFGYNNNPKVEDNSNDEIEVYKTGNNTNYSSNDNNYEEPNYNRVTNVYVLPPGYYNPWDSYGMGYPNYYFYWDNWRYYRWAYFNPYSYWDYGWYNPYRHYHHYYDHYYYNDYNYGGNYDNQTPKRKDYRDFGVSRGDFGSPSRNVTSSSSSRDNGVINAGAVRNVNSSNSRSNSNDYNRPASNSVDNPTNQRNSEPEYKRSSTKRSGSDVNIRQSAPRREAPSRSNERVAPSNSGSSSSPSRSNTNSSPSRSSENKGENSGQKRR